LPTDKDPITRAKSNLLALQHDNTVLKTFGKLNRESTGDDESIQAFLDSVKTLAPYIDDVLLSTSEYGVGDILLAPFVVSIDLSNALIRVANQLPRNPRPASSSSPRTRLALSRKVPARRSSMHFIPTKTMPDS
jgi:hypothetical protein